MTDTDTTRMVKIRRIRRFEMLRRQAAALCASLSHEELLAAFDYGDDVTIGTERLFRLMDVSRRASARLRRRDAALRQAERSVK
jgi:hypothetical protein